MDMGPNRKDFKEAKLHRIRLVETFTIHTDYYGPNPNEV